MSDEKFNIIPMAPKLETLASEAKTPKQIFPHDAAARKEYPVYSGLLMYFPLACAEVSHVSYLGNQQHSPGQPLQWVRGKSADQMDAMTRHSMEYGVGVREDEKGYHVLAQAAWRALAELELALEANQKGNK